MRKLCAYIIAAFAFAVPAVAQMDDDRTPQITTPEPIPFAPVPLPPALHSPEDDVVIERVIVNIHGHPHECVPIYGDTRDGEGDTADRR